MSNFQQPGNAVSSFAEMTIKGLAEGQTSIPFDPFNEYVGHKISVIVATGISIEGHLTGIQGDFLVMSSGKVQKQYVVHVRRLAMANEGGGPRPTY